MIIAGGNVGRTSYGKNLPDGSLTVIKDGRIILSVSEERLNRTKSSGGFENALKAYMSEFGVRIEDLHEIVLSSCCDSIGASPIPEYISNVPVRFCPHHLSHALGSYVWSGFDEAIAIVIDSGGDLIGTCRDNQLWWMCNREQHSIFYVGKDQYKLLKRHASKANDVGFGELFRAVTFYLGWHASRSSGNTMALSSLGTGRVGKRVKLFEKKRADFVFPRELNPQEPIGFIQHILDSCGLHGLRPRHPDDAFCVSHFEVAAALQRELERYLKIVITDVIKDTGIKNIIITGGVAYNCLAIGKMASLFSDANIFAQPASGDVGQSLGNACFGYLQITGRMPILPVKAPNLGLPSPIPSNIYSVFDNISSTNDEDLIEISKVISAGHIVIFHNGRSEYGPRALGFRSILASCHEARNKRLLNRLKNRSYFMPIAPVVCAEDANMYFYSSAPRDFMAQVVKLRSEYDIKLRPASHLGNWCRLQTVDTVNNNKLYRVIRRVGDETGLPVLLNTSLNGPNEPICETVEDSISFMLRYGIKYGWIDGKFLSVNDSKDYKFIPSRSEYSEMTSDQTSYVKDLKFRLGYMFPDAKIITRKKFLLNKDFIKWVLVGRKHTTVRFKSEGVEVPSKVILPLFVSEKYEKFSRESKKIGEVRITSVLYKAFADLNERDANMDGFEFLSDLKKTLLDIYGVISPDDMLTIYSIKIDIDKDGYKLL